MTPVEAKKLEEKINRLEKKLNFVIRYITISRQEESDWLDDPRLAKQLNKLIKQAESDIADGRLEPAETVFKELGV